MSENDVDQIIDDLGGTTATAALCGVTTGAVSQWRKKGIPRAWRKFLGAARPDVFSPDPAAVAETENQEAA